MGLYFVVRSRFWAHCLKKNIIIIGSYKFMGVEEVWLSNWPFVVGDFYFVEGCYQA